MNGPNPCLECGACCAFFRASFYWGESNEALESGVPIGLTEKLNDFRLVMLGTNRENPWCIALKGIIGKSVFCSIHPQRASVCRDFSLRGKTTNQTSVVTRPGLAGVAPLHPNSWTPRFPGKLPRAA